MEISSNELQSPFVGFIKCCMCRILKKQACFKRWNEENKIDFLRPFYGKYLLQNLIVKQRITMGGAFQVQPAADHAKIRVKTEVVGQRAKGLRRGRGHRFFFSLTARNQIVKSLDEKKEK